MTYKATPCSCGYPTCKNWFVEPVADIQGVSFTEEQARLVAVVLNAVESSAWRISVEARHDT